MTPLLKLKISSHLRIQRLRSNLPKHPEFAVSGCICYGYEHLNHTFILHSKFKIQIINFQTNVILKVDYTEQTPNVKSGPTDLSSARQESVGLDSNGCQKKR